MLHVVPGAKPSKNSTKDYQSSWYAGCCCHCLLWSMPHPQLRMLLMAIAVNVAANSSRPRQQVAASLFAWTDNAMPTSAFNVCGQPPSRKSPAPAHSDLLLTASPSDAAADGSACLSPSPPPLADRASRSSCSTPASDAPSLLPATMSCFGSCVHDASSAASAACAAYKGARWRRVRPGLSSREGMATLSQFGSHLCATWLGGHERYHAGAGCGRSPYLWSAVHEAASASYRQPAGRRQLLHGCRGNRQADVAVLRQRRQLLRCRCTRCKHILAAF